MKIVAPFYPIVFVRGFAFTNRELKDTFYDPYNGFNKASVNLLKHTRQPYKNVKEYFEGMIIKFMKMEGYNYFDQHNEGIEKLSYPYRSLWVCRFYDIDFEFDYSREIQEHAKTLLNLVTKIIPQRLTSLGVEPAPGDGHIKVTLIAHSMGGLICRTMMQTLLPNSQDYIHRLITLGTPHKGIELKGKLTGGLKLHKDLKKFHPDEIVNYLKLNTKNHLANNRKYEAHSLGIVGDQFHYPVKKCMCIIGSDYERNELKFIPVNSKSDGLVLQSNAFLVEGAKPIDDESEYPESSVSHKAIIEKSHTGINGIVNCEASFTIIKNFLFGDTEISISLVDIDPDDGGNFGDDPNSPNDNVPNDKNPNGGANNSMKQYRDIEYKLSIQNTGVFTHVLEQESGMNAIRLQDFQSAVHLNSFFLKSEDEQDFSIFKISVIVNQIWVNEGLGQEYDVRYPFTQIFSDDIIIAYDVKQDKGEKLLYKRLSYDKTFNDAELDTDEERVFKFKLGHSPRFKACVRIEIIKHLERPKESELENEILGPEDDSYNMVKESELTNQKRILVSMNAE